MESARVMLEREMQRDRDREIDRDREGAGGGFGGLGDMPVGGKKSGTHVGERCFLARGPTSVVDF